MSGTAIGQIERAETFMALESLFLVASAFGIDAAALIADLDALVAGPSDFSTTQDQL